MGSSVELVAGWLQLVLLPQRQTQPVPDPRLLLPRPELLGDVQSLLQAAHRRIEVACQELQTSCTKKPCDKLFLPQSPTFLTVFLFTQSDAR